MKFTNKGQGENLEPNLLEGFVLKEGMTILSLKLGFPFWRDFEQNVI